jgi:hypothetical protein
LRHQLEKPAAVARPLHPGNHRHRQLLDRQHPCGCTGQTVCTAQFGPGAHLRWLYGAKRLVYDSTTTRADLRPAHGVQGRLQSASPLCPAHWKDAGWFSTRWRNAAPNCAAVAPASSASSAEPGAHAPPSRTSQHAGCA